MASITREELIQRATALAPTIAARAAETEKLRAPHDETIAELIDAELMETLVPRRWGGHELDLETHVTIVEIISAACMSTGWILAFYMGHNWMATKLPERAQEEIFADRPFGLIPATTSPTMQAKRVTDGWEVSGRSKWGSGIMHGDWVLVGGMTAEQGPTMFLLPIADVQVDDVWNMSAMAGTGSNDFVIEAAFVPDYRSVTNADFSNGVTAGTEIHDNPIYTIPVMAFIHCEAMCVITGGLRGATAAFDETVRNRVTTHARTVVQDQQSAHIQLGEAHTNAMIAEHLMREQIRQTQACVARGGFDLSDRTRLRAHAGFIGDHCRQSVNKLMNVAGSTSFASDSPIQRHFRDINMLATHAFMAWQTGAEQYGRNLLGLEPTSPLI